MKPISRLAAVPVLAMSVLAAFASPAFAHPSDRHDGRDHDRGSQHAEHAVFVQTDDPGGNAVVAYDRSSDGTLTAAAAYPTGGNGGVLTGSVVDHLASQGSLTYDAEHSLLFAVNAGSNSLSVFSVRGSSLTLSDIVPTFGDFPVSVSVHDDLVYVLNARSGGSVQGYEIDSDHLFAIPGSNRALGLDATATPEFTHTPGQVAFTPDGSQLVVTTKANTNSIDVFGVTHHGTLSATPVVNAEAGAVPFAVTFDWRGNLVVAEAGTNSLATFDLHHDGTITLLQAVPTGQAATCWIAGAGGHFYASNAGSGSVSGFDAGHHGALTFLGDTSTDPGTVDAVASARGDDLYVQTGANGIVDEYRVGDDGSLSPIGSVTVAGAAGGEGIAAD